MVKNYTIPDMRISGGTLYELMQKVSEAETSKKSEAKVYFNGTFICMASNIMDLKKK